VGKVDSVEFGAVPTSKDEKPIVVVVVVDSKEVEGRNSERFAGRSGSAGVFGDRVID